MLAVAAGGATLAGCSSRPLPPSFPERDIARMLIGTMSVEEKAAQLFVVTPEQVSGMEAVWQVD